MTNPDINGDPIYAIPESQWSEADSLTIAKLRAALDAVLLLTYPRDDRDVAIVRAAERVLEETAPKGFDELHSRRRFGL
jgi:hypothetical protein